MRAHQQRAAAGGGLDQVLPAQRLKAAAQQGQVGQAVIQRHLTERVTQPNTAQAACQRWRIRRRPGPALAAPLQRKTLRLNQRRHLVKALRMARHDQPLGLETGRSARPGLLCGAGAEGLFFQGQQQLRLLARARTCQHGHRPAPSRPALAPRRQQASIRAGIELEVAKHARHPSTEAA